MTDEDASFALDPTAPLTPQLPGLVEQEVAQALARFESGPPATAVHEARKMLKRLRALLRLGRGWLGDDLYRQENYRYRDVARLLAGHREQTALLEIVDKLMASTTDPEYVDSLCTVRGRLDSESAGDDEDALIAQAREALPRIAADAHEWSLTPGDDDLLVEGLRRTYRQGRRRLAASRATPTAETLHEWRKAVKYLWTQLGLLAPAWPAVLEPLAEELHHLSDLLGEDHDLHELARVLAATPALLPTQEAHDALCDLIDERRHALQQQAWTLGERLYTENPSAFAGRIIQYWRLAANTPASVPVTTI